MYVKREKKDLPKSIGDCEWCGKIYWRRRKPNNKFQYFMIHRCETCGRWFLTDKYRPIDYCSYSCKPIGKGRPIGTQLSDETKETIGLGRTGHHHNKKTRDKISKSVINNGFFD